MRGAGTFATVHQAGVGGIDLLTRLYPRNGLSATIIGETGYTSLWGLGFRRGNIYGFSEGGELVLIDTTTGAGRSWPGCRPAIRSPGRLRAGHLIGVAAHRRSHRENGWWSGYICARAVVRPRRIAARNRQSHGQRGHLSPPMPGKTGMLAQWTARTIYPTRSLEAKTTPRRRIQR